MNAQEKNLTNLSILNSSSLVINSDNTSSSNSQPQASELVKESWNPQQDFWEYDEIYSIAAQVSSDVIVVIDENSNILYANPAAEMVLGYNPTELLGQSITILMPPHLRAKHKMAVARYIATNQKSIPWQNFEVAGQHKDGRLLNLEISFGVFSFAGHLYFTGIIRDISSRKQTMQELATARQQLKNIFDNLDHAFWSFDIELRQQLIASPGHEKVYGYPPQTFLDNPLQLKEVVLNEDRAIIDYAYHKSLIGETFSIEYRIVLPDSQIKWVETRITPHLNASGKLTRLDGVTIDINRRKLAEIELQARLNQQALVAELGQLALNDIPLEDLLNTAVIRLAQTLEVDMSKVLELQKDQHNLIVIAGAGWKPGVVGTTTITGGPQDLAGYTLLNNAPVVIQDIQQETRFQVPALLYEHGVVSAIRVIIQGQNGPYGILAVDTTRRRDFNQDDINCLQAVANILASAIKKHHVERELRLSEARFSSFMRNLPGPAFIIDGEGRQIYSNKYREAIFNLNPGIYQVNNGEELETQGLAVNLEPDQTKLSEELIVNETVQIIPQSDGDHYYLIHKFPIFEGSDAPILTGGVGVDITERQRAEQRLTVQYLITRILSTATTLENAIEQILPAIGETLHWDIGEYWWVDNQSEVLRCFTTWQSAQTSAINFADCSRQFTFRPGVGLPGRVWQLNQPAWIESVIKDANFPRRAIAVEDKIYTAIAFPICHADEVIGVLEFFSCKLRRPDPDLLRLLSIISQLVEQFIERSLAEEKLRQSDERFRQISENINEVFWISDPNSREMLYISPAYEKLFGRSCQSLYLEPHSFLEAIVPEDRPKVLAALENPGQGYFDEEYRVALPDGSI